MLYNCPKCGAENKKDAKYCTDCGLALGAEDTPTEVKALTGGTILANRYEIIKRIKSGGMGSVYQAKHTKLGKIYAVKELLNLTMDPREQAEAVERFELEARILSDLNHPNLPSVSDYFSIGGRHYLVMDFVDGKDLSNILEERGNPGLDESVVVDWCLQVCDVLHYLHTRTPPIIYRDIKPSNIMIREKDNKAILIDFGIARTVQTDQDISSTKTAIGTAGYMSPEQYRGRAEVRSDIYSLGATIYHLLTGTQPLPFTFPNLKSEKPEVSDKINAIVMTSLRLKPQERFQTAQEMKNALMGLIKVEVPVTEEPDKLDLMILQLNVPDSTIRKFAIKTLGDLKDAKAIKPLLSLLKKEKDWKTRRTALETLAKFELEPKIEEILKDRLLNDEHPEVRAMAAQVMGIYSNKTFSGTLILGLDDQSDEVRMRSIMALGRIREDRALKPLQKIVETEPDGSTMKEEAIIAIDNIDPNFKGVKEWRRQQADKMEQSQSKTTIISIITIFVLIIGGLLAFKYFTTSYKAQKIKEHMDNGWSFYKNTKLDRARDEFKKVLNIASSAEAYYGIGVTYCETDPDKARQNLLTAVKMDPNHPYINSYLGSLAFTERNYTDAMKYYEKAMKLAPKNPEFYGSLMEVCLFSDNKEKGKAIIKEYRKAFPGLKNERIEDIIKMLESGKNPISQVDPKKDEKAFINQGVEYLNQQKYDEAIKKFEQALQINVLSFEAEYGLGLCYIQSDKEKAKSHLAKAIQFNPNYAEPYVSLAEIYFTENDNNQTIEYCTKGITIAPQTAKLHLLLGLAYYRSGNKLEAIVPLKKYLELEPNGTNATTVKQIIEQIK